MTYHFPLYISLIPVLIALAGIGIGAFLTKKHPLGLIVLIPAILFAITFGPIMFCDHLTITDNKISHRTGMWFRPMVKEIDYSNTQKVIIKNDRNKMDHIVEMWHIIDYHNETKSMDPGDLWVMNRDSIINKLKENSIEVSDQIP